MAMKVAPVAAASAAAKIEKTLEEKAQTKEGRYDEFVSLMKRLDETRETPEQMQQRKTREEKAIRRRREQERKVNNLRGRIAFLRSRVMANPEDKVAAGELAMANTQFYWATNSAPTAEEDG